MGGEDIEREWEGKRQREGERETGIDRETTEQRDKEKPLASMIP